MATLYSCSFSSLLFPSARIPKYSRPQPKIYCRSSNDNNEMLLFQLGMTFLLAEYLDGSTPSDEWFKKGKFVKAYPVSSSGEKAKDPIFGLTMGQSSQAASDLFRIWILSDKPQPKYGFDYTLDEYVASMEYVINARTDKKVTLVVQLTMKHVNLPSSLSILSNFLLGEIFCQDPLRASDKKLLSCGPYQIKEDVAMVYRRPYLTSGSAGFALNVISKAMKK